MTESDLKLQIVIQGLGLLVALVLVIWLYTIYQRWLNNKMRNLGDTLHSSFVSRRENKDSKKEGD